MGLNVNLFIHGVPMGQKIWGPKGDDSRYLSTFYGPKWEVPEVMKIDVMTLGGSTYCYYSYVKGQNVCASDGRTGSYFALTIRMNAFYSDIQGLYNILRVVYEKMCLGLCVQQSGNTTRYLLSDFQAVDSKLKEMEKHLLNYISEYSVSSDIVSLAGFQSGPKSSVSNLNLYECTSKIASDYMKQTGGLLVSPCFLSSSAANTVKKYQADMQSTVQKAMQEVQLVQQTSKEKIENVTKQLQEKIDATISQSKEEVRLCKEQSRKQLEEEKANNDRKLEELRQSYADFDKERSDLQKKIKDKEKEVSVLNSQCREKDKELQSYRLECQKLEGKIGKLEDKLQQTKKPYGGGPANGLIVHDKRRLGEILSEIWNNYKKLALVLILVIIVLFVSFVSLLAYNLFFTQHGDKSKENARTEHLSTTSNIPKTNQRTPSQNEATVVATEEKESEPKIKIKNFNADKDCIEAGKTYTIEVSGCDDGGEWKCEDLTFTENTVMANREKLGKEDKTSKISYVVKGKEIASLKIRIKGKKDED